MSICSRSLQLTTIGKSLLAR